MEKILNLQRSVIPVKRDNCLNIDNKIEWKCTIESDYMNKYIFVWLFYTQYPIQIAKMFSEYAIGDFS